MADIRLRIATYNIRKARGLDQRHRPDRVMAVIRSLAADVVVLQEADHRLGRRPSALPLDGIERATGLAPVDIGPDGSLGWHGNAVLVRPGITVAETACLKLPGIEPRGAVRAELETPIGPLRLLAVHLGLRRGCRTAQAERLSRELSGLAHKPVVLAGDFNEWSRKRPIAGLDGLHVTAPGHSFPAFRPLAPLDRIAYSPDLTAETHGVWQCEISRRASDHLPVWTDLSVAA